MHNYQTHRSWPRSAAVSPQEHLAHRARSSTCAFATLIHNGQHKSTEFGWMCRSMEGWKDEFANLVHRLEAAEHARESACLLLGGQVCMTRSRAQHTEVLGFWFSGLLAGSGRSWDLSGLGEGRIWQRNTLEWSLWKDKCVVLAHTMREDGEIEVLRQFAALSSGAGRGSRQRGLQDKWNCGDVTHCVPSALQPERG